MIKNDLQQKYFDKIVCSQYGYFYLIMNFLHLLLMIGAVGYPIVLKEKNEYDFYYLIFLYVLICQWILLKNECLINYCEKIKIDPEYKLGTNILSPGINYIFSYINMPLYNQNENNIYNEDTHNLFVPTLTFLLFTFIAIRYYNESGIKYFYILIYVILIYILLFKVSC